MLVVAALGGNALLRRGERLDAQTQRANARHAATVLAELAREHQVVVTHGNGPQVGMLALQALAYTEVPTYPLDVLGAESEGMIGYLLDQELFNALPDGNVATLLTQVVVDADDPAFQRPTKPIGPVYSRERAGKLANELGWAVQPDTRGWRRVVPSPEPQSIVEQRTIELLIDAGVTVICNGGGGIPVIVNEQGNLQGIEAVIDKDRSAALLAWTIAADALLLLTDVDAVYQHWGTDHAAPIRLTHPNDIDAASFAPGSMGPKVEAAAWFASCTGRVAGIGALEDATAVLQGTAGTRITATAPLTTARSTRPQPTTTPY